MALSWGRAPFAAYQNRVLSTGSGVVYSEPWLRRMRAELNGDGAGQHSRGGFYRTGSLLSHYFPLSDFDSAALEPAGIDADGRARWALRVGGRVAEVVVLGPTADLSALGDASPVRECVTLDFGGVDRWFEEDEPLYAHICDPYHRVDVRGARRRVVARIGDTVLADSARPKMLFETALPVRFYVPWADVALQYLTLSDTISECLYKGDGQHWNVIVAGTTVRDVTWSLSHPLPEGLAAAEHVCFYNDRVEVSVDGQRLQY